MERRRTIQSDSKIKPVSIRRSNPIDRSINSNLIHGGIRTIRQAAWLKLAWIKINPISKLADRRKFPARKSRTVFREDRKRKKRLEGTRGRRVACRELVYSTVRFVLSVSHSSSCSLLVPFTTRRVAEEAPSRSLPPSFYPSSRIHPGKENSNFYDFSRTRGRRHVQSKRDPTCRGKSDS